MLQVNPKSRDKIISVNRDDDCLIIKTLRGMLRIEPKRADIIRIRYTLREHFQTGTGVGICREENLSNWHHEVTESEIRIFTEQLMLRVSGSDAAVQYSDRNGKVLLSERPEEPRELEEFDAYRILEDGEVQTEDVATADGIKKKVCQVSKKLDEK